MRTERESALRLLQLLMVASLVFPAALFVYASYNDYRDVYAVADERIDRSLDVLQEQALKVFETVDRVFPEVGEVVRGMSDDQIRAAQESLTPRLQRIVGVMPQVQSIVLIGRDGRLLASSVPEAMQGGADFSDRDDFKAQSDRSAGTYVGDVHPSKMQAAGADLFDVSRRLPSADGAFRGVIAIAVRPRYFDDFYSMIEQSPGNFYALARADGGLLARYPAGLLPSQQLSANSMLRLAIGRGLAQGLFSAKSEVDGRNRRVGFRKLPGYPVYAIAGIDTAAIRAAWLARAGGHLVFGLPVTLLLFFTLWVALRRTRRLHDEAERRELAEDALRQAQRLEAIGQLTGGVAHDFNNLLMIVSGTVQRLRRHLADKQESAGKKELAGDRETQLLDIIANATQRGESLTRQLLAFSRRQMLQPSVIDLAERLPEIKDMLSRSLRGDIDIRLGVPRRPCAVKVDPSEFELALLNLAVNARDAMPSGGTLTISAKPVVMRGKGAEEGLSGEFVAVQGGGYRHRHSARCVAAGVRAVLHHQRGRQGHRARLEPGLRLCPAIRRRRQHHDVGAARHRRHAVSAADVGSGGAAAPRDRGCRRAAACRHGARGRRQRRSRRSRPSLFRAARLPGPARGERAGRPRSHRTRGPHRSHVLRHIDARRNERACNWPTRCAAAIRTSRCS